MYERRNVHYQDPGESQIDAERGRSCFTHEFIRALCRLLVALSGAGRWSVLSQDHAGQRFSKVGAGDSCNAPEKGTLTIGREVHQGQQHHPHPDNTGGHLMQMAPWQAQDADW